MCIGLLSNLSTYTEFPLPNFQLLNWQQKWKNNQQLRVINKHKAMSREGHRGWWESRTVWAWGSLPRVLTDGDAVLRAESCSGVLRVQEIISSYHKQPEGPGRAEPQQGRTVGVIRIGKQCVPLATQTLILKNYEKMKGLEVLKNASAWTLSFPGILPATSQRDGKNKLVIDPGGCRRALKTRKLPQSSVRPLRTLKSRQCHMICNVTENTDTSKLPSLNMSQLAKMKEEPRWVSRPISSNNWKTYLKSTTNLL